MLCMQQIGVCVYQRKIKEKEKERTKNVLTHPTVFRTLLAKQNVPHFFIVDHLFHPQASWLACQKSRCDRVCEDGKGECARKSVLWINGWMDRQINRWTDGSFTSPLWVFDVLQRHVITEPVLLLNTHTHARTHKLIRRHTFNSRKNQTPHLLY